VCDYFLKLSKIAMDFNKIPHEHYALQNAFPLCRLSTIDNTNLAAVQ
jgi:hypothetical protein